MPNREQLHKDSVAMNDETPQVCIDCHAERLGKPVTANDCLGFVACETCTKLPDNENDLKDTKPTQTS